MYKLERSEKLKKILKKLFKKDKVRYEATLKKIDEVINTNDPNHYKNLSYDMKTFKRVHIDSHFVLIFKVDENETDLDKLEKILKPLEHMEESDLRELTEKEANKPLAITIELIKLLIAKQIKEEIQELKKEKFSKEE